LANAQVTDDRPAWEHEHPETLDHLDLTEGLAAAAALSADPRTVPETNGPEPWRPWLAWCIRCGQVHNVRKVCHRCWCIRCAKSGQYREPLTHPKLYDPRLGGFCLECWAQKLCAVCGANLRHSAHRCATCATYYRRNGRERPERLWRRQPALNLSRVIRREAEYGGYGGERQGELIGTLYGMQPADDGD
jgi:hypothetical protein